ncbi:hypothetical protein CPB83DRAFT_850644 [Crepidotus variabilis]|uniref:Uncharacterized protein n=1 Tax=Crepidotus variabilis TaxID=179855 RepID=A0A9P6EKP8_9AGAR|nr:hypothetical protein CPB83DRAFT_850644 [Crepidotus variabilis]
MLKVRSAFEDSHQTCLLCVISFNLQLSQLTAGANEEPFEWAPLFEGIQCMNCIKRREREIIPEWGVETIDIDGPQRQVDLRDPFDGGGKSSS